MRRKIPRSPLLQEKDVRLAFAEAPPHGGSEGRDGTQVQWPSPPTRDLVWQAYFSSGRWRESRSPWRRRRTQHSIPSLKNPEAYDRPALQQTADDDGQHIDNDSDWHRLSLFPYVNFTENSCLSIVQEIESFIKQNQNRISQEHAAFCTSNRILKIKINKKLSFTAPLIPAQFPYRDPRSAEGSPACPGKHGKRSIVADSPRLTAIFAQKSRVILCLQTQTVKFRGYAERFRNPAQSQQRTDIGMVGRLPIGKINMLHSIRLSSFDCGRAMQIKESISSLCSSLISNSPKSK